MRQDTPSLVAHLCAPEVHEFAESHRFLASTPRFPGAMGVDVNDPLFLVEKLPRR